MEFLPPTFSRPTVTFANCVYAQPPGFRALQLDVHVPARPGPHPVVLWIHGGGWTSGSRLWLPDSIAPHGFHDRLLARGYAVADIDYRLAAEATYPAQLTDVQGAIRWLRHFADRLGLDPARFATLGESAGGHLAAMAGLTGSADTAIQAVVNWYGAADLAFGDLADPSTPPGQLLGGAPADRMEFARWASPLHRVHPGAPPFISVHGTADTIVPFEQSVRLTEALRAAGVRAELIPVQDAEHCFVGHDRIGDLIERCADFLDGVGTSGVL